MNQLPGENTHILEYLSDTSPIINEILKYGQDPFKVLSNNIFIKRNDYERFINGNFKILHKYDYQDVCMSFIFLCDSQSFIKYMNSMSFNLIKQFIQDCDTGIIDVLTIIIKEIVLHQFEITDIDLLLWGLRYLFKYEEIKIEYKELAFIIEKLNDDDEIKYVIDLVLSQTRKYDSYICMGLELLGNNLSDSIIKYLYNQYYDLFVSFIIEHVIVLSKNVELLKRLFKSHYDKVVKIVEYGLRKHKTLIKHIQENMLYVIIDNIDKELLNDGEINININNCYNDKHCFIFTILLTNGIYINYDNTYNLIIVMEIRNIIEIVKVYDIHHKTLKHIYSIFYNWYNSKSLIIKYKMNNINYNV